MHLRLFEIDQVSAHGASRHIALLLAGGERRSSVVVTSRCIVVVSKLCELRNLHLKLLSFDFFIPIAMLCSLAF
jgi:hypothetical protein